MFGALVGKEIAETVLNLRFVIATLLCVVLIPLGMYVSRKDYGRRLASYQREHQMYRQRHGTPAAPATGQEEAQGFRLIQRMAENDRIVSKFMDDKEFQNIVYPLLAKEIFMSVNENAAGEI